MRRLIFVVLFVFLGISTALAQDAACDMLIDSALTTADSICRDVEVGSACYGFPNVTATARDGATIVFNNPGDSAPLGSLAAISLDPADAGMGIWGIAVLHFEDAVGVVYGGAMLDPENMLFFDTRPESGCDGAGGHLMLRATGDSAAVTINGVEVSFDGLVSLTPVRGTEMTITALDGEATVTVGSDSEVVETGMSTSIDFEAELEPSDSPSDPAEVSSETLDSDMRLGEMGILDAGTGDVAEVPWPVPAAGTVIPRAGRWQIVRTAVYQYTACPGETLGSPGEHVPDRVVDANFDFSEGLDIPTFVQQQTGSSPPEGAIYDEPAPNVYHATDHRTDPPIEFSITVVSETELVTATIYYVDYTSMKCGILSFNYWAYQGD